MKKWIMTLLLCGGIFSAPATISAHTHLSSTNPADGDTVTEPLPEITLTFEGQIEQGSTFNLAGADGTSVALEDITVADGEMTGTLAGTLENGDYIVQWNSISADGHPMEGEFSFTVAAPVTEEAAEQTQPVVDEATAIGEEKQVEGEDTSSSTMIIIVVALVLVIGASFFFLLKRRK